MSKYTLLKKWHPSQVEEVGHVFEESIDVVILYRYACKENLIRIVNIQPHEIALLCEAGFLEKQEEVSSNYMQAGQVCGCGHCMPNKGYELPEKWDVKCTCKCHDDPQLELWTECPPEEAGYWYITDWGIVGVAQFEEKEINQFRLKTKNCHRTQKSAEEALKRLLA